MKTDIHPTYHTKAQAKCACGNTFTVGSTAEVLEVEVCSACHPFYTGTGKVIDTAGRVEKFKARRAEAVSRQAQKTKAAQKTTTKKKKTNDKPATPSATTEAEADKEK